MSQLTTFLRSFGARGAEDNARMVLDARRREDWAVAVLSARLTEPLVASSSASAPAAGSARAA